MRNSLRTIDQIRRCQVPRMKIVFDGDGERKVGFVAGTLDALENFKRKKDWIPHVLLEGGGLAECVVAPHDILEFGDITD